MPDKVTPGTPHLADILHGEEAEIAGLRTLFALQGPALFLLINSHKVINTNGNGSILVSRTAITAELLSAILGQTILKCSTTDLDKLHLDLEAATAGAAATEEHGSGRALVLVRVAEQPARRPRERATSYLLGALAQLDPALLGDDQREPVLVCRHGQFPDLLGTLLRKGDGVPSK